jgi:hypothetical protein
MYGNISKKANFIYNMEILIMRFNKLQASIIKNIKKWLKLYKKAQETCSLIESMNNAIYKVKK